MRQPSRSCRSEQSRQWQGRETQGSPATTLQATDTCCISRALQYSSSPQTHNYAYLHPQAMDAVISGAFLMLQIR